MTLNPAARRRENDFALGLGLLPLQAPVASLLALRTQLEGAATPRPEFRDALRQRLVAVATVAPHQSTTPVAVRSAARLQRRMVAATGGLAAVVAVSGVAVAGESSLPGEAFYGVKRAGEQVQLWAARGDASRGDAHLAIAGTRLDEASALARGTRLSAIGTGLSAASAGADGALVAEALVEMDEHFRTGSTLLLEAWRAHRDDRTLAGLNDFSESARDQLAALMPSLPAQAQPQARASLALLGTVGVRTDALLRGVCGPACASVDGGACDCPPAVAPLPTGATIPGAPSAPVPAAPAPSTPVPATSRTPAPGAPSAPGAPTGASTPGDSPSQGPDSVDDLLDLLAPGAPSEGPSLVTPSEGPSAVSPSGRPSAVSPPGSTSVPTTVPTLGPAPLGPVPLVPVPLVPVPLAPVLLVPPAP